MLTLMPASLMSAWTKHGLKLSFETEKQTNKQYLYKCSYNYYIIILANIVMHVQVENIPQNGNIQSTVTDELLDILPLHDN